MQTVELLEKNGNEGKKITKFKVSGERTQKISKPLVWCVCVCLHARVCFVSACACARQSLFCILTVQEEGKSPRSQPVATKSGFLVARFPGIDEAALSPGSKHVLFLTCFHGS